MNHRFYSEDVQLSNDMKHWEHAVDSFSKGNMPVSSRAVVMGTPLVFSLVEDQIGVPIDLDAPLIMHYSILHKILKNTQKHALNIDEERLKTLPAQLSDPIMILRNRDGQTKRIIPGEIICVLDTKDKNGKTIIVPITLKYTNGAYSVKTFFGKIRLSGFIKEYYLEMFSMQARKKTPHG